MMHYYSEKVTEKSITVLTLLKITMMHNKLKWINLMQKYVKRTWEKRYKMTLAFTFNSITKMPFWEDALLKILFFSYWVKKRAWLGVSNRIYISIAGSGILFLELTSGLDIFLFCRKKVNNYYLCFIHIY